MAMAPTINTVSNYSIFAIPAYLVLAMTPHIYSSSLLSDTKPKSEGNKLKKRNLYNMGNPRSTQNAAIYSNSLPPHIYARYERARAAHHNMLENSAFVVSAILAGVVTRCDAKFMNWATGIYLVTRVAYIFSYIAVSRGPWTLLRTACYTVGNGALLSLWWVAGKKVMDGNY